MATERPVTQNTGTITAQDGTRIFYKDWGSGQPVVFSHGWPLNAKQFNYGFTNMFPPDQAAKAYERYAIPGSRSVLFEGANCNLNPWTAMRVDYKLADRAPLLFIAGGNDHVIPAKVNKHNAEKYSKSSAITEYIEYPGRSHFTMAQDGWEEIADYALDWAVQHAAVQLDGRVTSVGERMPADFVTAVQE